MKSTHVVLILILCGCLVRLSAQQLPLFTQYGDYQGMINPAGVSYNYFKTGFNLNFGTSYRSQYAQIPDGPRTIAVHGEYIYNTGNKVNLLSGGYLMKDETGALGFVGAYARFAGVLAFDEDYPEEGAFSAGITGGLIQYRIDQQRLRDIDATDPEIDAQTNKLFPDVGLGVSYFDQFKDNHFIFLGFSIPQVFGLKLDQPALFDDFQIERNPHIYFSGSYIRQFDDEDQNLEVSTWVRFTENAPINYDLLFRYKFTKNFSLGFGGSSAKIGHVEINVFLGENINLYDKEIKIGYSYDPSFSDVVRFFGNTHEINISINFTDY